MDIHTAFASARREAIIANCATSRVCRRCAGNTMILDTDPIRDEWQAIDKFGFGWHPFEPYLFGKGGRWSGGSAKSYFYTRIETLTLAMEFQSPFPSDTKFQFLLSDYDPDTRQFSLQHSEEFYGRKNQLVRMDIQVNLQKNTFHRLTILSPTFSPKKLYGSPDERRLGLAVTSLRLVGRPFEELSIEGSELSLVGAPAPVADPSVYSFPILS
jgi:hypothetical protein